MPPKRTRLDLRLVEQGFAATQKMAAAMVMAAEVYVDDRCCTQPGTPVGPGAVLRVKGKQQKYASRGGEKLAAALEHFKINVRSRVVLDAGASTGGFTDCLLQHGAARVYAVDVGFGQLRGRLACDARVVVMERTNIGDLRPESLQPPIDLATLDLSYLSLRKAVVTVLPLFAKTPELIVLVKPLFEGVATEDKQDEHTLMQAVHALALDLRNLGLEVKAQMRSPILGSRGTTEFLMHLVAGEGDGLSQST